MADTTTKRTDKRTETHECDYISRQDAIGIFTQLWDCIGTIMDRDEWEDVCRTTANELPSAQPEHQWIIDALKEHLGEVYKPITENEKEFKNWLERMHWHVLECDKLARELEQAKASAQPEIIRCKECKYWFDIDDGRQKHRMCAEFLGSGFVRMQKGELMSDDLIDRQAAIEELRRMMIALYRYDATAVISCAIYKLQNLPSAEPNRKMGKWIHDGYDHPHGVDWMHCSECGKRDAYLPATMTNYCPNCGAMMEGSANE